VTLDAYCTHKVVILGPMATAREAARAMSRHHIGVVLVGEHGRVDGTVTDRDLALCVVGEGTDPKRTTLESIMSDVVTTVDISGTLADIVDAMMSYTCRSVPITKHGKVVGLVTLDDLIAGGVVSAQTVQSIVKAQLEAASLFGVSSEAGLASLEHAQAARSQHERRVENSFLRLLGTVQAGSTLLSSQARAATALGIVVGAVCRRLNMVDATHLLAQLPLVLRQSLHHQVVGPDRSVNAALVIKRLVVELGVDAIQAEGILVAIGEAIAPNISRGELLSLRAHLPPELKELFPQRTRLVG